MTASDPRGLPIEHHAGDPVPDEWLAERSKGEIAVLVANGMLRDPDAPPPARQPEPPPQPLTVSETLRNAGWWDAAVVNNQVTNGPQGCEISVMNKAPRESDLKQVLGVGRETQIVVHEVDGVPVATLSFARLAQLLANRGLMR
jgi:hypothetical protein